MRNADSYASGLNHRSFRGYVYSGLILIAAVSIYYITQGSCAYDVRGTDGALEITTADKEVFDIPYDGIVSVEERTSFTPGDAVKAKSNSAYKSGTYRNEELGEYTLAVTNRIDRYIIAETADGTIVFNYDNSETTHSMYEGLVKMKADNS